MLESPPHSLPPPLPALFPHGVEYRHTVMYCTCTVQVCTCMYIHVHACTYLPPASDKVIDISLESPPFAFASPFSSNCLLQFAVPGGFLKSPKLPSSVRLGLGQSCNIGRAPSKHPPSPPPLPKNGSATLPARFPCSGLTLRPFPSSFPFSSNRISGRLMP